MTQPDGGNRQRVVAKDRLETLSGILNQSANEARDIYDFDWMVTDRVKAQLPETYQDALSPSFIAEMWLSYEKLGYCTKAETLREMEWLFDEENDSDG